MFDNASIASVLPCSGCLNMITRYSRPYEERRVWTYCEGAINIQMKWYGRIPRDGLSAITLGHLRPFNLNLKVEALRCSFIISRDIEKPLCRLHDRRESSLPGVRRH